LTREKRGGMLAEKRRETGGRDINKDTGQRKRVSLLKATVKERQNWRGSVRNPTGSAGEKKLVGARWGGGKLQENSSSETKLNGEIQKGPKNPA